MAPRPRGQRFYEDISDDALIDLGADCESRLAEIEAELGRLRPEVLAAARGLRRSTAKLGANITLGIAGIALALPTFGLSLLVTVGTGVHADLGRYRYGRRLFQ
jgi:hypothetical protein